MSLASMSPDASSMKTCFRCGLLEVAPQPRIRIPTASTSPEHAHPMKTCFRYTSSSIFSTEVVVGCIILETLLNQARRLAEPGLKDKQGPKARSD